VDHHEVIPNVCIHLANEQPLLADLFDLPQASDAGLVCTNVRSLDGKRPVFIDSCTATFFFPYHIVRFLEIPEGAVDLRRLANDTDGPGYAAGHGRASGADPQNRLAVVVGAPGEHPVDGDLDVELEIDEDFLQRIRDI
jgi:hypothetical protein